MEITKTRTAKYAGMLHEQIPDFGFVVLEIDRPYYFYYIGD